VRTTLKYVGIQNKNKIHSKSSVYEACKIFSSNFFLAVLTLTWLSSRQTNYIKNLGRNSVHHFCTICNSIHCNSSFENIIISFYYRNNYLCLYVRIEVRQIGNVLAEKITKNILLTTETIWNYWNYLKLFETIVQQIGNVLAEKITKTIRM
jgi:hypothetical protein